MGKIFRRVRSNDSSAIVRRRRGGNAMSVRTRDDYEVKVADFSAAHHFAVEEGELLVVYARVASMDGGNITNGVDNRGLGAAVARQTAGDRRTGPITPGEINQKNRSFWGRQNGGGGR